MSVVYIQVPTGSVFCSANIHTHTHTHSIVPEGLTKKWFIYKLEVYTSMFAILYSLILHLKYKINKYLLIKRLSIRETNEFIFSIVQNNCS